MTRDNIIWTLFLAGAVITGVAANFSMFPWIPERAQHGLSFAAFIWAIVSAKLGNSPLKGEFN